MLKTSVFGPKMCRIGRVPHPPFGWDTRQQENKHLTSFTLSSTLLTSLAPTGCLSGSCLTWKGLIIGGLKPLKGTTPLNRATTDSERQELSYHKQVLHIMQWKPSFYQNFAVSLCVHFVCDDWSFSIFQSPPLPGKSSIRLLRFLCTVSF